MELALAHLHRARSLATGIHKVEVQVDDLVRRARSDFGAFCAVMGKPNAKHHELWVDELVTHQDSRQLVDIAGPPTAVLAPRGSAKSTVLGLFVAWAIGRHTQAGMMLRLLYLAYSLDIARSRSHTIKAILRSRKYREVFPMVRISRDRQSDELWAIDYEFAGIEPDGDDPYTLVAQGLSGSITSRRSQLIVLDDVIKSSRSIKNPDIRAAMIHNWNEVVKPTLLEGGRCVALGTRFSTVDIFETTFNVDNGWRIVTQRAIEMDDEGMERSYWPEFYSLEHLQRARTEDPISFSFQFQNQPVSTSEIDFPRDWLIAADLVESYDTLAIGVDLSSGIKQRNDWTVFTFGGLVGEKCEIIDFRRIRAMGNIEKVQLLLELLADWGVVYEEPADHEAVPGMGLKRYLPTDTIVTVNFEAISYQNSIRGDALRILHDVFALHNIVLRSVTGWRGDKLERLRGYLGLFQTGRISWNRWINWDPYWSELLNFGDGDHDDCVDSLVLTLKQLAGTGKLQTAWNQWSDDD